MEHRRQRIIPVHRFALRMGRYTLVAIGLILFSVGIGVLGYRHYADLNCVDSLYMASMILTGMGPVSDMPNDAAKIFSSIYALYSGVAFLSITAVFFAPVIHRILHILQVEDEEN